MSEPYITTFGRELGRARFVLPAGWHPIESAPKDGSPFLAWNGFWHVVSWCSPTRAESDEGEILTYKMERPHPPLTHWMALPEGPGE